MDDYVDRRDVIDTIATKPDLTGDVRCALYARARAIKPADVIPRATIEAGIEETIALLNSINGEGRLDYSAYSELHDAITGILPEKEADSDG